MHERPGELNDTDKCIWQKDWNSINFTAHCSLQNCGIIVYHQEARDSGVYRRQTVNRGVCVSVLSILAEAGGSPSLSAVVRQGAERGSAG